MHRRLRVRVLEADGAPARERWFRAYASGFECVGRLDAEGWLVLDPAPAGRSTSTRSRATRVR